jgi:hypothetical protein
MKCHRDGCDSAAEFHVGLECQCIGKGYHKQTIQAPTTIKVCQKHMHAAAAYVLSPENKTNIARGLINDGIPTPDFSSAEIVFVPIRAAENNWQAAREAGTRH